MQPRGANASRLLRIPDDQIGVLAQFDSSLGSQAKSGRWAGRQHVSEPTYADSPTVAEPKDERHECLYPWDARMICEDHRIALLIKQPRGVIARHDVDSAICDACPQGVLVSTGPQRRIDLQPGALPRHVSFGVGQVMRASLDRNVRAGLSIPVDDVE